MNIVLRFLRVLVGQLIGIAITTWGGINIPYLNITIGAVVSALFKFLREKFADSEILLWLPL
jgi:hypothetical protein